MQFSKYLVMLAIASLSTAAIAQTKLTNEELNKKVEILADEINQLKAYQMSVSKNEGVYGLSPSASKVYHIPRGLSVGAYGEMTYLHERSENQNGDPASKDPESEVLRNIIYLGYKFNDKWLINMELEIEHVSQVFTEFMYLDYLGSDELNMRLGLILHPIGFVNELHEPTVFLGVLRPQVETVIIPTTWRSIGGGVFGSSGKSTYKVFLLNGMNAQGFTLSSNRGARKRGGQYNPGDSDAKLQNQRSTTGALVYRYDFQATDNLMIGSSGLVGQASGDTENLNQRLLGLHAEYTHKAHKVRFLGMSNYFDNASDYNTASTEEAAAAGTTADNKNFVNSEQRGAYLEYSYSINKNDGSRYVPFIRHESINLQHERANGIASDKSLVRTHTTIGMSYYPHEQIVLKGDYTINRNDADSGVDEFALGMGYNF